MAGKAPDGCLSTELAYVDPAGRFAFCYPADMELITTRNDLDGLTAAHVRHTGDKLVSVSFGIGINPYDSCAIDSMDIAKDERIAKITVDGQSAEACFKDHYDREKPDIYMGTNVVFRVFTEDGRPVIGYASYRQADPTRAGTTVEDVRASRVLESTVIY